MPAWGAYGLMLLLIVTPVPFGSVMPWAWAPQALLAGLMLLPTVLRAGADPVRSPALDLGYGLVLVVILWALVQMLAPVPGNLQHPAWNAVEGAGSISLDRRASALALTKLALAVAVFHLARLTARDERLAWRLVLAVALTGTGIALYALVLHHLAVPQVLWVEKVQHRGFATGTFISRNHLAAYMLLSAVCWLALLSRLWRERVGDAGGLRLMAVRLAGALDAGTAMRVLGLVLVVTAALQSGSRSGFLALLALIVVSLVVLLLGRRRKRSVKVTVAALSLGVVLVLLLMLMGGLAAVRTLETTGDVRLLAWQGAVQTLFDRPLLGTGLGTFALAYRPFRPEALPTSFLHAHNDYLEMAIEIGLVATLLWLAALLVPLLLALRSARGGSLWGRLGVQATKVIAVMSLFDSALHIPAIAVTYAALMGIAVGRATAGSAGSREAGAVQGRSL